MIPISITTCDYFASRYHSAVSACLMLGLIWPGRHFAECGNLTGPPLFVAQ